MKKIWTTIAAALVLAAALGAGTAYAHDAEYGMMNGEQDGLLLGTVEEAGEDWAVLKDVKALPSGDKGGFLERQLPPEEVPERLKVTGLRPYGISYSGAERPQAGQYMLVSADRQENGDWKALWPPYEVSSPDPDALEFQPEGEKTLQGFAWEWFVHTGGAEHNFSYDYGGDVETLCIRRTQADGSVKDEIIFQMEKPAQGGESGSASAQDGTGGQSAALSESETAAEPSEAAKTSDAAQTSGAAEQAAGQAEARDVNAVGLEAVLIAVAAGFFGGMVITRLKKKKR